MKIFGKLRTGILSLLLLNDGKKFYVREIALLINCSAMGALKELNKLEDDGIVRSERKGKLRFFSINPKNPSYAELKGLIMKSSGLVDVIREALGSVQDVAQAFIFGSFARGEADYESDIDLFIIGNADFKKVSATVSELEKKLAREINVDLMSLAEYEDRLEKRDPYVLGIERGKKIYLVPYSSAII